MNFCSHCAAPLVHRIPAGDNRPRYVCEGCGLIHYSNPKIIAGCLPVWNEQVLLCKRAIEPRRGLWTLPAGFMENGETTQAAAQRETSEEACARVEVGNLYCYLNIPRISQVYVIFIARLLDLDFSAGEESLEVALFDEADIPWDTIAFPAIEIALQHYFEDRKTGVFPTRVIDVARRVSTNG
jgi:ADP-ribose pyrophosphatase YjhB (NUDIX family)